MKNITFVGVQGVGGLNESGIFAKTDPGSLKPTKLSVKDCAFKNMEIAVFVDGTVDRAKVQKNVFDGNNLGLSMAKDGPIQDNQFTGGNGQTGLQIAAAQGKMKVKRNLFWGADGSSTYTAYSGDLGNAVFSDNVIFNGSI